MSYHDSGSSNWRDRIDFPCSYSFYRSLHLQHGEQDPGPCYEPVKELPDIWKMDVSERYFEGKKLKHRAKPVPSYTHPGVKDISL